MEHSDPNLPARRPARVGLIGYGYWGKRLYGYLAKSDAFDIAHVYSPTLGRQSRPIGDTESGPEFTRDIERIWRDETAPHVIIATPIATHAELAMEAIRHGKNVLVEKPLTPDGASARRVVAAAKARTRVLETEYTYTYSRALEQARDLIDSGAVGVLRSISIRFRQLGRFQENDVYVLLGSHALSILDMFVPIDEFVFSGFPLMETGVTVTGSEILGECASRGVRAAIEINLHSPQRERSVLLCGEQGTVSYDPRVTDSLEVTFYERAGGPSGAAVVKGGETFQIDENHNLARALGHFALVLEGRRPDNSERSLRICEALDVLRRHG